MGQCFFMSKTSYIIFIHFHKAFWKLILKKSRHDNNCLFQHAADPLQTKYEQKYCSTCWRINMTLMCTNIHTVQNKTWTHVNAQKQTIILQPTGPWAPLWMDRRVGSTFSAFSLCLRPLSTDSCFLTKPTLLQADPVIMRLCPEPQATREQCQQLGADLLNGLASPRSQREQKLHLIVWVESGSLPRGIVHVQY